MQIKCMRWAFALSATTLSMACGGMEGESFETTSAPAISSYRPGQGRTLKGYYSTSSAPDDEIVGFKLSSLVSGGSTVDRGTIVEGRLRIRQSGARVQPASCSSAILGEYR